MKRSRKVGKTPREYLRITLEDIVVSNYTTGGVEQPSVMPLESVCLNFARFEIQYREQKADGTLGGSVIATHDLKQNRTS